MAELSGFPYAEVQLTRDGDVHETAEVDRLVAMVTDERLTDLVVVSHGWNNHLDEARGLYRTLLSRMRAQLDAGALPGAAARRLGVNGVLWPSKKFAERELIPSGAASALPPGDDVLTEQVEELAVAVGEGPTDDRAQRLLALVPLLEDDPEARREFADTVRDLLPRRSSDEEDASDAFFEADGADLMDRLAQVVLPAPRHARQPVGGGVAGGAAVVGDPSSVVPAGSAQGLGDLVGGAREAARRMLNYATYYVMKDRAGLVGRRGLADLLRRVHRASPQLRIHLVGHSFGARVVTSAAAVWDDLAAPVASMTLLQAAFSHNAFAEKWNGRSDGAFRTVVADGRVAGPIVITCTRNDKAVGVAYPIASRIARQAAAGLGDRNDPYGGLGRNGTVHTREAVDGFLLPAGSRYTLTPGRVYNLVADDFIADHGDVANDETAYVVLAAVDAG